MPFVPRGLESQKHPLKHRFAYEFGLSAASAGQNSAWCTLVRGSKQAVSPEAILVNPHHTSVDLETGPLCAKMSIIENLRVMITMSKSSTNNADFPMKLNMTPFFASFGEKYDAADDDSGTTVAGIMQLTKDDTNEDIVPLTTNNLPVGGNSVADHPVSTVNFTEVFGTYNMTTDLIMEDTPFDAAAFYKLINYGTNKGALKACLGRTRRWSFDVRGGKAQAINSLFIKKFVPRAIRRIVPFTYFGLLFHVPLEVDEEAYYQDTAITAAKSNIGIKVLIRYDEWNEAHSNVMV